MAASVLSPFFPEWAANEKNLTETQVASVFSVPMAAGLVAAPFSPRLIAAVGPRKTFYAGLLVNAGLCAAFSLLSKVPKGERFLLAALGVRAAQGAATAVADTAGFGIATRAAPQGKAAIAIAWLEATRSIGMLAAPPIGGYLFKIGGFALPFLVVTVICLCVLLPLLLFTACNASAARSATNAQRRLLMTQSAPPATIRRLLRFPVVWMQFIMIIVALTALTFLQPTLQPFLAQPPTSMPPITVGLAFSTETIAYIFSSVLAGPLSQKIGSRTQLILGSLLVVIGFLLIGPAPFLRGAHGAPLLPRQHSGALVFIALGLIGTGSGLAYTPTNDLALEGCRRRGVSVASASDPLGALVNLGFLLGALSGPLLGGALVDYAGFPWASTGFGLSLAALLPFVLPCLCEREPPSEAIAALANGMLRSEQGGGPSHVEPLAEGKAMNV